MYIISEIPDKVITGVAADDKGELLPDTNVIHYL
jgi:hypothetical protein